MDFAAKEASDGIRFSWNYWPTTKPISANVVVPVAALYTPLKEIEGMQILQYQPVLCRTCSSVLNPCSHLDFKFKVWTCPFCSTENHFPQHYAQHISETNLPGELMKDFTTVEYVLPGTPEKPIFVFIVDTCVEEAELAEVKDSLQQSLNLLPEDA